ncbi:transcriptional activator FtrA [Ewingella americana]|uniref:Transcriptional activator FtrA n=1 Tax=Ewingella americana TaxID=41202 RepID=A0A377NDB1_9GAMM|nr:transcriptional activator FtrA [Ewingella americana]
MHGSFCSGSGGVTRWPPGHHALELDERFIRLYPSLKVDQNVLYVDDGDIVTSAGTSASIDCCLHLVRQQCGADIANSVARQLVVPPHRQGGQAQFVEQPVYNTAGGDRFMQL